MADNELIEQISLDNREAFDLVYQKYWEKLFLYVVKVIRDRDEAQDIIQEIFVSLWLRRKELGSVRSLSAYLFTAARYKGLTYIQAGSYKSDHLESIAAFFSEQQDSLSQQLDARELEALIGQEVQSLPPKMKVVFSLSRTEGLSHKEVSERLGISDKTVKKQIGNAIKQIRLKLAGKYLSQLLALVLIRFL